MDVSPQRDGFRASLGLLSSVVLTDLRRAQAGEAYESSELERKARGWRQLLKETFVVALLGAHRLGHVPLPPLAPLPFPVHGAEATGVYRDIKRLTGREDTDLVAWLQYAEQVLRGAADGWGDLAGDAFVRQHMAPSLQRMATRPDYFPDA